MEALIAVLGVVIVLAAVGWMVSPTARYHIRRAGVAVIVVAVAVMVIVAYVRSR